MAYINLNATNPAAPAGAQNVHFRQDSTHLGTAADPYPVSAYVEPFTGDTGSGGVSGIVPAPVAGDAENGKVLGAGGAFVFTPRSFNWSAEAGAALVGSGVGPALIVPAISAVSAAKIWLIAADAASALELRVKRNGNAVSSGDWTIPAGSAVGQFYRFSNFISSPLMLAVDDVLTLDIIVGGAGWAFTLQLE